jgi:hypothetical protein
MSWWNGGGEIDAHVATSGARRRQAEEFGKQAVFHLQERQFGQSRIEAADAARQQLEKAAIELGRTLDEVGEHGARHQAKLAAMQSGDICRARPASMAAARRRTRRPHLAEDDLLAGAGPVENAHLACSTK